MNRIIKLLFMLLLFTCSMPKLFAQESIKAIILHMYNAESDEESLKAFQYLKAISLTDLALENDTTKYLYHYCYAGGLDISNGDTKEKIVHIRKALEIRETKIGIFNSEYLELLWALGTEYQDTDIDEAINIFETAIIKGQNLYTMAKTSPVVRHWYGECITSLAHCFERKKYHKQIIQAYRAGYELLKDQYDKEDKSSYYPLYLLAAYYSHSCKDYDNAISVMAEVMQHIKEHEGENCKRYADCLYFSAADYAKLRKYEQAEQYYNKAINIIKACTSNYDTDLQQNYTNLFLMYIEQGDLGKAFGLCSTLTDYFKLNQQMTVYYEMLWCASRIIPKDKEQPFMQFLNSEFDNFNDSHKADLFLQMAESSIFQIQNKQKNPYATTDNITAWLNKASELTKSTYSTHDVRYIRCLYGYANLNIIKKDSVASLENLYSIRDYLRQIQADTTELYGTTLNRIDFILNATKDYRRGAENALELHRYTKEKFGSDSREYGFISNMLGIYYMNDGDYKKAMNYFSEADNILFKIEGESGLAYETVLHNIGRLEMLSGNKKKAIKLLKKSKELQEQYQKSVNPKTEQYLQDLAVQ